MPTGISRLGLRGRSEWVATFFAAVDIRLIGPVGVSTIADVAQSDFPCDVSRAGEQPKPSTVLAKLPGIKINEAGSAYRFRRDTLPTRLSRQGFFVQRAMSGSATRCKVIRP